MRLLYMPQPSDGLSKSSPSFSSVGSFSITFASAMFIFLSAWVFALLASRTQAQSSTSTSTYVESDVPTGTPVPGNYTGELRPQVHYSPPTSFMNDPNGMFVDANGTYHLYYQYNPTSNVAGNQHWGHATSRDLYHWINQPIAIYPGATGEGIFSGSAVIDVNNTSGFFPDQDNGVVAFYTLNTAEAETQNIAYSHDGGYTFTKYAGNPVIPSNSTQFRDPKVFYHAETESWVMVIAYAQEFTIGIYTSADLITWTHASNFSHYGLLGLQYECPNLLPMPMVNSSTELYVLWISINPGAPLGGSISQYFPGTFNGTHFTPVDNAARISDFAKDNYAGQFFGEIPGTEPQIAIQWASNWQYAQNVPTGEREDWRSAMGLPRTTYLANITRLGYDLIQQPYNLSSIMGSQLAHSTSLANQTIIQNYTSVASKAVYLDLNITNFLASGDESGTLNFTFYSSDSPTTNVSAGFFLGGDSPFWIDRRHSGPFAATNPFFTGLFSTSVLLPDEGGSYRIQAFIDRSILEVFLDNGKFTATATFYPPAGVMLDTVKVGSAELAAGVGISADVWSLKSAWAAEAGSDGIVKGNVTTLS
ncbi:MAG: hypothetical protein M1834_002746 [Cirrosporium novae-zelandiae]|nr:MAG: hypothetical protein M1834_002746 [Cirrosporium novae-zelandiae]